MIYLVIDDALFVKIFKIIRVRELINEIWTDTNRVTDTSSSTLTNWFRFWTYCKAPLAMNVSGVDKCLNWIELNCTVPMYHPGGMKARVKPVQWSKPHIVYILTPTQDSNPGGRIIPF